METRLLTLEQAAELLQLHPRTVVAKARSGEIPGSKLGGGWRFWRPSLEAVLSGRPVTQVEPDGTHPWLSTAQAADLLGTSRQTVLNLLAKGQLPAAKVAGRWRVDWWRVRNAIATGEQVMPPHDEGPTNGAEE